MAGQTHGCTAAGRTTPARKRMQLSYHKMHDHETIVITNSNNKLPIKNTINPNLIQNHSNPVPMFLVHAHIRYSYVHSQATMSSPPESSMTKAKHVKN